LWFRDRRCRVRYRYSPGVTASTLIATLWRDYTALTPQAARIHALFAARGEQICNDHVALRTFARPGIEIDAMARPFIAHGWQPRDRYRFDDKHLEARYWQHPDRAQPKVFISQLCVDELPAPTVAIIDSLVATLADGFGQRRDLPYAGRPWSLRHSQYQALLAVSEYAAWVAAFGFRVNHFTVDIEQLHSFSDLDEVNQFLLAAGFELNRAGGLIKGSPAELLEQSSTCADAIEVEFADGRFRVPSCYYEFARRYCLPSGERFHGFVPTSANQLFQSTDVNR
jgi:Domain of unknown function (DUF1338)